VEERGVADITMCSNGKDCPRQYNCYRYTAVINPYKQSYDVFFMAKDNGYCRHFWDNTGRINRKGFKLI